MLPLHALARFACLAALCCSGWAEQRLPTEDRILVLGDSITYAEGVRGYVEDLETAFLTRFPDRNTRFIDVGLPSETVSGLSEPGAAARPCLFDVVDPATGRSRIDAVLHAIKPQLVLACYGMNDGAYLPLDQARFEAFKAGMTKLHDTVVASGARVLHLTPPVYDRQDPYAAVIEAYAQWLVGKRADGWDVVDIHGAMAKSLQELRKQRSDFRFADDGVHPGDLGHLLIAQTVLEHWGFPAEVDHAVVDAATRTASAGSVESIAGSADDLSFSWRTRLPLPLPQDWDSRVLTCLDTVNRIDRHRLSVVGLTGARYRLQEGETTVGVFSAQELAAGIDLARLPALSSCRSSLAALELECGPNGMRQVTTYGWLTETGYTGQRKLPAWPLADATASASGKEKSIRELCAAPTLRLRLVRDDAR